MKRVQYATFALSIILICIIAWTSISGFWLSLFVFTTICSIAVMFIVLKLEARWNIEKVVDSHKQEQEQLFEKVKALNETIEQMKQQSEVLSNLPVLNDRDFMGNVQLLEEFFAHIVAEPAAKDLYTRYFRQTKDNKYARDVLNECRNTIVRPFLDALSKEELPLSEEYKMELLGRLVELAMVCIDISENAIFYSEDPLNFKPYVALLKGLKTRNEIVEDAQEITNYPDTTPRNARVIKELLADLNFDQDKVAYFGYKITKE